MERIKMFEDKHIFKFVCALLAFASIIIQGPLVPIISLIIAIAMLVYKIKRAKESPEGFEQLMLDIICIVIVLVMNVIFFAIRISAEYEYNRHNYLATGSQEMTSSDLAETIIAAYKLDNFSQFSDSGNHQNEIKNGFSSFLKDELDISDVSVKGNRITCNIETEQIIFTVTRNDIKYNIK